MNRKVVFIILFTVFGIWGMTAQTSRIKQLKTAYITQQLDLSTKEARAFWPIYDKYYDALETYRRDQIAGLLLSDDSRLEQIDSKQAEQILNDYTTTETEIYEAKMELITNLENVISKIKIAKLLIAEKNFNKQMLQRFQRRN